MSDPYAVAWANVEPAELSAFDHPGFVDEWITDDHCRIATADEHANRKCRRPRCGRAPVLAMLRSGYRRPGNWWLYCDQHTYGRRIRDGIVEFRRFLAEDDT